MNMNNKTVALGLLALLALAGGLYYFTGYRKAHQLGTEHVPVTATQNTTTVITQADKGKTITVKQGTVVAVALGTEIWTLDLTPRDILTPIENVGGVPGLQGIYTTNKAGTVKLSGEGRPNCKQGEMCAQYIVNFTATIIVKQ